jgi:hypothetical protein
LNPIRKNDSISVIVGRSSTKFPFRTNLLLNDLSYEHSFPRATANPPDGSTIG